MDKKKKGILKKACQGKGGLFKDTIKEIPKTIKRAKDKVIDFTSDAMSYPTRMKYKWMGDKADRQAKIIKTARAYDDAPDRNSDGTLSDAYKFRSASKDIKERLREEKRKLIEKNKNK